MISPRHLDTRERLKTQQLQYQLLSNWDAGSTLTGPGLREQAMTTHEAKTPSRRFWGGLKTSVVDIHVKTC